MDTYKIEDGLIDLGVKGGFFIREEDHTAEVARLKEQVRELAAESAKNSGRMQQLIQIISNADNAYCMCGDEMKNHSYGGCGQPTGMFDYRYGAWMQSAIETPATEAILNEVRARELDAVAYELAALDTVGSTGAIAHVIRQKAASIRAGEVQHE